MTKKVEVIVGGTYWINDDKGGLIAAKWDGESWLPVPPPKAIEPEEAKSITTIIGSKYNFTEQVGDRLVSYGFDALEEMKRFVVSKRNSDDAERTLKL